MAANFGERAKVKISAHIGGEVEDVGEAGSLSAGKRS